MIYLIFRPFSNIDEDLEDIEYDHPDLTSRSHLDIGDLKDEVLSVYHQVIDLKNEVLSVYHQVIDLKNEVFSVYHHVIDLN